MKTKGWQKVFSFTLVQYVKTRAFIASTIVTCVLVALICVLTNVLPNVTGATADNNEPQTGVEDFLKEGKIYLYDDAEILTADDKSTLSEIFKVGVSESEKSLSDIVEELKDSEAAAAAVQISAQKSGEKITGYSIHTYYSPNAKDAVEIINNTLSQLTNRRILLNAGVSPEKYEDTQVSVTTSSTAAGGKYISDVQNMIQSVLPMAISMILFLLIFVYGSIVAQSIAMEKTSRVMELLLTSVRPLAVVVGKVLAMGLVSIMQLILIVIVAAGSFAASSSAGWMSQAFDALQNPEVKTAIVQISEMQQGDILSLPEDVSPTTFMLAQVVNLLVNMFTPLNIAMAVVILILGFLFYSLIAALVGASISRMEDLQAAMSPYSMIGMVGFYLAYFPSMFGGSSDGTPNGVTLFSYYFPFSSPFALPSAVFNGTLDFTSILIAIAVLCVFVVLVAVLVGKVYEAIVLHNGNRIKFGDILKMAVRK